MIDKALVLHVELDTGQSREVEVRGRGDWLGGSGLAAQLFERFGVVDRPALDPRQPLIFAIGPLTGYFPLQSKVVLGFMSPYHDQYAESHCGGRLALALRFTGYEALVITGRAPTPSCLIVEGQKVEIKDVHYLWGADIFSAGKLLRRVHNRNPGQRSILRIGPAGERKVGFAAINVDTYRHFGRLGGGAVMGDKLLKGMVVAGDQSQDISPGLLPGYNQAYKGVYQQLITQGSMDKYHDLGTAERIEPLNSLQALPWRNLQSSQDQAVAGISGQRFADELLLRQVACAGCPIGCIHVGLLRERFGDKHEFYYRQVNYDYELIFALGSMLGLSQAEEVMTLLEDAEGLGLDVISSGVALAWATEALDKGVIGEGESLVRLNFGELGPYRRAFDHLARGSSPFYQALAKGTAEAVKIYGGQDFACLLGQEMAGYATGEVFFVSQAYGFRHSHLDSGGYNYDLKDRPKDVDQAVQALIDEEAHRVLLNCMVGCLFARKLYTKGQIQSCLEVLGYGHLATDLEQRAKKVQAKRWGLRFRSGFDPAKVSIPKRFFEVKTWKGSIDARFLSRLAQAYQAELVKLAGQ